MGFRCKTRVEQMWRGVAITLLALLCGALATPFATAQASAPALLACCRSMHGCSLRMHHAAPAETPPDDRFGALQERCPCTPLAPSSVSTHGAPEAVRSVSGIVIAAESTLFARVEARRHLLPRSGDGTRGPPGLPDLA